MLHPDLPYHQLTVKAETKLEEDLYTGNASPDAFVVAYVSKMFAVPASALPQNQRKPLTAEEMRQRGRASREAAAALAATGAILIEEEKVIDLAGNGPEGAAAPAAEDKAAEKTNEDEESLLGFSRLYSGVMKAGQTLYAVLPKYNAKLPPSHPRNKRFITPVKIDNLYMMMGKELVMVDQVPAGNVFAIGGLEGKILRNGTLCGYGGREVELDATGAADKDKEALVNLAGLNMTVSCSNSGLSVES
jgi:ribosome assembly protein 1